MMPETTKKAHHVRIELYQHRNAADHCLDRDADPHEERQPEQCGATTSHADNQDEGCQCRENEEEGEHSVGELDNAVNAHFGRVDQGFLGAHGPRGTTETAGGEAHRTTSNNNPHVESEINPPGNTNGTRDLGRNPAKKSLSNHRSLFWSHQPQSG